MNDFRLSRKADQDVDRIYAYGVHNFGRKQADLYFTKLFDQFGLISEQPYSFPVAFEYDHKYRRCVFGTDTIFYQIQDDNSIVIIRILGRQDQNRVFQ